MPYHTMHPRPSIWAAALAFALGVAPSASAQDTALTASLRAAIVADIGSKVEQMYVFPEVASQCREHLDKKLNSGAWDAFDDRAAFGEALTDELRLASKDLHMLVRPQRPRTQAPPSNQQPAVDPLVSQLRFANRLREQNFDWKRVEVLDGNVGYIDLHGFAPLGLARDTAAAAMAMVSQCDALVFDMRRNGGGSPHTVQFVCSYFFDQPTHLNTMYWREGDRTQEFWTVGQLPGPTMPDIPLYVLTSHDTFSGAEEFAYNLRHLKRATLIGETTRGGAHPGRMISLAHNFEMFMPVGRAINPVTGANWEGTGVEPHHAVPAEEALDVALGKARPAAAAHRQAREQRQIAIARGLAPRIQGALNLFQDGDQDGAVAAIEATLRDARHHRVLDQADINRMGYEQLEAGHALAATAIFRCNTAAFPSSSNAWDSLAGSHAKQGQTALAIQNYERALALNPNNENAAVQLERLRK